MTIHISSFMIMVKLIEQVNVDIISLLSFTETDVSLVDTGKNVLPMDIMCIYVVCWTDCEHFSPQLYPLAMLGGFLWETGNICVVPIIKTIGLGLGLCIWEMSNLFSGWATGSAFIFAMVKNEVSTAGIDQTVTVDVSENSPLLQQTSSERTNGGVYSTTHTEDHDIIVFEKNSINREETSTEVEDESFIDKMSPTAKRIFGVVLSLVSGVFYGQMFTPAIYVQNRYHGSSQNALDYVFDTLCGILATSTVYFLIYAAYQRNRPKVYPRAILPGFVSGLMWGVGTTSWFVANKALSEAVAFPIITTGPGIVASLLGVLVFKEIQGRRNIMILLLAMTVTITGSVLAGFSKA